MFKDYQYILEFATAAFCIKHTIPGDWNLTTKEEVISLMESSKKIGCKKIN